MQDQSPAAVGYCEGQVWEYETRPGDAGSLLKIQKVEPFPGLERGVNVYHVSIIGVHLGKPGLEPVIEHVPVSIDTLDASVTRLSTSVEDFPSADEGIDVWRSDEGGVFTIPMAKIVRYLDEISQQSNSAGSNSKD